MFRALRREPRRVVLIPASRTASCIFVEIVTEQNLEAIQENFSASNVLAEEKGRELLYQVMPGP